MDVAFNVPTVVCRHENCCKRSLSPLKIKILTKHQPDLITKYPSHHQDDFCYEPRNSFLGGATIEISIYNRAIAP